MERTEKDDGTLFVLKKSHDYHEKFFKENDVDSKSDWYKFNDEEKEKLLKKFENVRVTGPPGSLFLWDSRTFHAPVTPLKDSNRRLVVYVCMAPAQWATANQLKKKKKAFEEYRSTSHWPIKSMLFQKPRTYGDENKELSHFKVERDRIESENMLLLGGCKSYSSNGLLGWTKPKIPYLKFKK